MTSIVFGVIFDIVGRVELAEVVVEVDASEVVAEVDAAETSEPDVGAGISRAILALIKA